MLLLIPGSRFAVSGQRPVNVPGIGLQRFIEFQIQLQPGIDRIEFFTERRQKLNVLVHRHIHGQVDGQA